MTGLTRSPVRHWSGTFGDRADQSRSLATGARARCQWQVRGCVQYWPIARAGWGKFRARAEGTADGDADPADRRRPAGAARAAAGPLRELRCAGHRARRHGPGRGGVRAGLGGVRRRGRAAVRAEPRVGCPDRVVRGRGAPRHPALHPRRAAADGRRGAVPGRPRRAGGPPRAGRRPDPAARGRGPGRGRGAPAARRPDPHRPLGRRRRPVGRPGRVPAALRGDGRPRRPRLGRRPGLDERHDPGGHARGHPSRAFRPGRVAPHR